MTLTKKNPVTVFKFSGQSAIQDAKSQAKHSDLQSAMVEVEVDPAHCRMNQYHRRGPQDIEPEEVESLSHSMAALGQRTPATGYQLEKPEANGIQYVLITGCRRREAAIKAGIKLRVRLHPSAPTIKQIVEEMWSENSDRRDYAPYYAALEMRQYIDSGAFANAKAIAIRFGIEETKVKRLLQVSAIPQSVIAAYKKPAAVPMASLLKVAKRYQQDPDAVQIIADEIVGEGGLRDATKRLAAAGLKTDTEKTKDHYQLVSSDGHRLVHVRGVGQREITVTLSSRSPAHSKLLALLREEHPDLFS